MKKTIFCIVLTFFANVFGSDKRVDISYFEEISPELIYIIFDDARLIDIHKLKYANKNMNNIIKKYFEYLGEKTELLSSKIDKNLVFNLFLNYIKKWQEKKIEFKPIDIYIDRNKGGYSTFKLFIDEFMKKINENSNEENIEILVIEDMIMNIVNGCKKIKDIPKEHPFYKNLKKFMKLFLFDKYKELEMSFKNNIYLIFGLYYDDVGEFYLFSTVSFNEQLKNNVLQSIKNSDQPILIDFATKDADQESIIELYFLQNLSNLSFFSKLALEDTPHGYLQNNINFPNGLLRTIKINCKLPFIILNNNLIEELYINNIKNLEFLDIRNNPLDIFDDKKCKITNLKYHYYICFSWKKRDIILIVGSANYSFDEKIKTDLKKTLELYKDNENFPENYSYKIWFNSELSLLQWVEPKFGLPFLNKYEFYIIN